MAGALAKFTRGFAEAGAELYGQKALTDMRAEIMAARDETLQGYRAAELQSSREFQTEEREKTEAFTSEENRLNREATTNTPQSRLASLKLETAEKTQSLLKEIDSTKDPKEHSKLIDKLRVITGNLPEPTANQQDVAAYVAATGKTPAEGWEFFKGKQGQKAVALFRAMDKAQENNSLYPGDEGYLTPEQMMKKAERAVQAMGTDEAPPEPEPTPTEDPSSLIKGQIYVHPEEGELKYLGGDPNKRSSYEKVDGGNNVPDLIESPEAAAAPAEPEEPALEGKANKSFEDLTVILGNIQSALEKGTGNKETLSRALDQVEADMQARLKHLQQASKRREAVGLDTKNDEITAIENYLAGDSLVARR